MFEKEKKRKREKAASFSTRFNSFLKDSVVEPLRVRAYMLHVRSVGFCVIWYLHWAFIQKCFSISTESMLVLLLLIYQHRVLNIGYADRFGPPPWWAQATRSRRSCWTHGIYLFGTWRLGRRYGAPLRANVLRDIFRSSDLRLRRQTNALEWIHHAAGETLEQQTDRQTHTKKKTRWGFEMMFSFDTHSELLLFGMASMSGGPTRVTRGPSHGKWHVTKCRALGGGNKTANVRRRSPQLVIAV